MDPKRQRSKFVAASPVRKATRLGGNRFPVLPGTQHRIDAISTWVLDESKKLPVGRGIKIHANAQMEAGGAPLPHCVAFYRLSDTRLLYLDINKSIYSDVEADPFIRAVKAQENGIEVMPHWVHRQLYNNATKRAPTKASGCSQYVELCENILYGDTGNRARNREALFEALNLDNPPPAWLGRGVYRPLRLKPKSRYVARPSFVSYTPKVVAIKKYY